MLLSLSVIFFLGLKQLVCVVPDDVLQLFLQLEYFSLGGDRVIFDLLQSLLGLSILCGDLFLQLFDLRLEPFFLLIFFFQRLGFAFLLTLIVFDPFLSFLKIFSCFLQLEFNFLKSILLSVLVSFLHHLVDLQRHVVDFVPERVVALLSPGQILLFLGQ